MDQNNKILLQQVENLKAKQALNQGSLQELTEKVEDKLNHLVHPVTLTAPIYSYTDKTQVEGQQAFGGLGLQSDPAVYLESRESKTGLDTNPKEVGSPWINPQKLYPFLRRPTPHLRVSHGTFHLWVQHRGVPGWN